MHYLKVVTFSLLTCAFFKLPNAPHEDRQRWACSMHPAGMSCADGAASAGNQCQSTAPNPDTMSTATVTFFLFLFLFPSLSPTFFFKAKLTFQTSSPTWQRFRYKLLLSVTGLFAGQHSRGQNLCASCAMQTRGLNPLTPGRHAKGTAMIKHCKQRLNSTNPYYRVLSTNLWHTAPFPPTVLLNCSVTDKAFLTSLVQQ